MKTKKEPYSQRTDAEKLESNWRKTLGLLQRSKYSMAIVRAGTCAEIAANIVARAELIQKRHLEPAFVDTLLRWANGLQGKFSRIILPVLAGTAQHATFRKLQKNVRKLNDARNKIAHTGRFAKSESAHKLVLVTHKLCIALTEPYEDRLRLPKPW